MWFRRHDTKAKWDPVTVQNRWRDTEVRGRQAFDKIFVQKPPTKDPNGFYDLCLAEIDGTVHLNRRQCFASMSDFITELRRLQTEPTTPSAPPFNFQVYAKCQKQWLDFVLRSTIAEACPKRGSWKDGLAVISAMAFLGLGVLLMLCAFDGIRASKRGLLQWQVFVGFFLSFFVFGLICKLLDERASNEKNGELSMSANTPK
jgi:hypothetical protein